MENCNQTPNPNPTPNPAKRKHDDELPQETKKEKPTNEAEEMKRLFQEVAKELFSLYRFPNDEEEEYIAEWPEHSRVFFSGVSAINLIKSPTFVSLRVKILRIIRNLQEGYPVPLPEKGEEDQFLRVTGVVCLFVQENFLFVGKGDEKSTQDLEICLKSFGLESFHWQDFIVTGCLNDSFDRVNALIKIVDPYIKNGMETFCTDNVNFGRDYFSVFVEKIGVHNLEFLVKFLIATKHLESVLQNLFYKNMPKNVRKALKKDL